MSRAARLFISQKNTGIALYMRSSTSWRRCRESGMASLATPLPALTGSHAQSSIFGAEPVGTASTPQAVTVTATTAGIATGVEAYC